MVYMSEEKRLIILPMGVTSKKETGAWYSKKQVMIMSIKLP